MADEIVVEPLDRRAVSQRRRRQRVTTPQQLSTIPGEWRELLTRWVRRGGNSRWETLRNDAGVTGMQLAQSLLDWLLREGWASVTEHRKHGAWWPQQVELRNLSVLRAALGINDRENDIQRWHDARSGLARLLDSPLAPVVLALDELPPKRAQTRADLVKALHAWRETAQSGTRRDFALFARGATKAITDAEWRWLEDTVDLADFGIERHTPVLLIAAPLTLHTAQGMLNLAACPDFAALTPQTLHSALNAEQAIECWRLIENRTSFERAARSREDGIGIIWLPGFPPGWWREAVARLLTLAPAPAEIACDPDPAGIAIAMQAGSLWQSCGLDWLPWKMTAADLLALPATLPLSDWDRTRIAQIRNLDMKPELAALLDFMLQRNTKGEQEGGI